MATTVEAKGRDLPGARALSEAVNLRYGALAPSCCSLSCGSALDLAEPRPGEVLVDLGSGRGADVVRAAGRVGAAGLAIGVDGNAEMLAAARASVPPFLRNACFLEGDLAALDLPDGTADVETGEDMSTPVPGLYVAGDIRAKSFRQITTAVADGTIAALAAQKYLKARR